MAQYSVTHTCGHEHTHHLTGPQRNRQWRQEQLAEQPCPACEDALREAARAKQNAASAAAAKAAGLPSLTGTEKQIAWAETIRGGRVREAHAVLVAAEQLDAELATGADPANLSLVGAIADKCDEVQPGNSIAPVLRAYLGAIEKTEAKWWIDNRDTSLRSLPEIFEQERATAEAARAKDLEREAVNEYRESVRQRLYLLFPEMKNWELKVGTWSGCKRVYFGGGYGKNFATLHVTGDRDHSPGAIEGGSKDETTNATLREILAEIAGRWKQIAINDSRS